MKTTTVRARVEPEIKEEAVKVFSAMGMDMSEAIRLFLYQAAKRQEFPVELRVPNPVTVAALQEQEPEKSFESVDDMFDELLNEKD